MLASWRAGNFFLLRARETGFGHFKLLEIVGMLLNGWSLGYFGDFGWGSPYGAILMGGLVAWGLVSLSLSHRSWRERLGRRLSLLCWLVMPVLMIWYISQWQPLFTDRYLIWAGLAFYLLVALGLAVIWRAGSRGPF